MSKKRTKTIVTEDVDENSTSLRKSKDIISKNDLENKDSNTRTTSRTSEGINVETTELLEVQNDEKNRTSSRKSDKIDSQIVSQMQRNLDGIDDMFKKEYPARFIQPTKSKDPIKVGIDFTGDGFHDYVFDLPISAEEKRLKLSKYRNKKLIVLGIIGLLIYSIYMVISVIFINRLIIHETHEYTPGAYRNSSSSGGDRDIALLVDILLTSLNALSALAIITKLIGPSIARILDNRPLQHSQFLYVSAKVLGAIILCIASHISAIVMMRFSVRHTENGKNSDIYKIIRDILKKWGAKNENIPKIWCAIICIVASLPIILLSILMRITFAQGTTWFKLISALKTIAFAIPIISSTILPAVLNNINRSNNTSNHNSNTPPPSSPQSPEPSIPSAPTMTNGASQ